jgi:hypothetical protein
MSLMISPNARSMTCNEMASPALCEQMFKYGCCSMHMKVMAEQFELAGDKLTHVRPARHFGWKTRTSCVANRGHLKLETGDDYKLDELKDEAWRIMTVERKSCT